MPLIPQSSGHATRPRTKSTVFVDGCRQYNTGRVCSRSKQGGVCQYFHNSRLRDEALRKKRADAQVASNAGIVAAKASRETVKDEVKVSTGVARSVDTPQALEIPSATRSDVFCRPFVRGCCKLDAYCPLVHDRLARAKFVEIKADMTAKKTDTRKEIPTLGERNPNTTITKSIPPPKSKVSEDYSKAITPVVCRGPTTTFDIQSWDSITLKRWATRNLSPVVLHKYLRAYGSYIEKGEMPFSALCGAESKKTKKTKNALEPLAEFHLFPRLPYELQGEIWNFYIDSQPQQCSIYLQETDGRLGFRCLSPLPIALVVNRYLREQALRRYSFTFGTIESKPPGYFNFQNDRLFICNRGSCELLESTRALRDFDRERVRVLAVPLRDWIKGDHLEFVEAVVGFAGLKALHVIAGDGREDSIITNVRARTLKKIQALFTQSWCSYYGEAGIPQPNVHIKLIPALVAKQYKIDGLVW